MLSNSSPDPLSKRKPTKFSNIVILKEGIKSLLKDFCTITGQLDKELILLYLLSSLSLNVLFTLQSFYSSWHVRITTALEKKNQVMKSFSVMLGKENKNNKEKRQQTTAIWRSLNSWICRVFMGFAQYIWYLKSFMSQYRDFQTDLKNTVQAPAYDLLWIYSLYLLFLILTCIWITYFSNLVNTVNFCCNW